MRQVVLTPGEDSGSVASVPSLPGAISQGAMCEEALANIREATYLVEAVMCEHGDAVPEDRLAWDASRSDATSRRRRC